MVINAVDDERVVRRTFPTASFTLPKNQIAWVAAESRRRRSGKSEVIRGLIEKAMSDSESDESTDEVTAA